MLPTNIKSVAEEDEGSEEPEEHHEECVKTAISADLNEKILGQIDEAELEADIEEATLFEVKGLKDIAEIEKYISKGKKSEENTGLYQE